MPKPTRENLSIFSIFGAGGNGAAKERIKYLELQALKLLAPHRICEIVPIKVKEEHGRILLHKKFEVGKPISIWHIFFIHLSWNHLQN